MFDPKVEVHITLLKFLLDIALHLAFLRVLLLLLGGIGVVLKVALPAALLGGLEVADGADVPEEECGMVQCCVFWCV